MLLKVCLITDFNSERKYLEWRLFRIRLSFIHCMIMLFSVLCLVKNNAIHYLCAQLLNCIQLFVTPWTVAHQALLSMRLPRQEYWSGLPSPTSGSLPNSGIEPASRVPPALSGRCFTTSATREAHSWLSKFCVCGCITHICIHIFLNASLYVGVSLVAQMAKNLPAVQETLAQSLGQDDPLEKEVATHSSFSCLGNPMNRRAGRLQSMGSRELDTTKQLNTTTTTMYTCIHKYMLVYIMYNICVKYAVSILFKFCFVFFFLLKIWLICQFSREYFKAFDSPDNRSVLETKGSSSPGLPSSSWLVWWSWCLHNEPCGPCRDEKGEASSFCFLSPCWETKFKFLNYVCKKIILLVLSWVQHHCQAFYKQLSHLDLLVLFVLDEKDSLNATLA